MDIGVIEAAPGVWHLNIAGTRRIIRLRSDLRTFAPWEICTAEGRPIFSAATLDSAFRWIEAQTGLPAQSLFAHALLLGKSAQGTDEDTQESKVTPVPEAFLGEKAAGR